MLPESSTPQRGKRFLSLEDVEAVEDVEVVKEKAVPLTASASSMS